MTAGHESERHSSVKSLGDTQKNFGDTQVIVLESGSPVHRRFSLESLNYWVVSIVNEFQSSVSLSIVSESLNRQ